MYDQKLTVNGNPFPIDLIDASLMNLYSSDWQRIRQTFQAVWGYSDFRPAQEDIIHCILAKRDALVIMPTGGGKSLCFQLPALMEEGVTLVVSPLVALMENQVKDLQQRQLPAALLHHQLSRPQRQQTLHALEQQKLRLLYLSPETLLSEPVWQRLKRPNMRINSMILDEAHCLVQWGQHFRPAYYRLGIVRQSLLAVNPSTPFGITAFTATADPKTQAQICEILQLKAPKIVLESPYRPNLNLKIQVAWTPFCRRRQLLQLIRSHSQESGLIYVRSRRESEKLSQWLTARHYSTAAYHAGLSSRQRREIENCWLSGEYPFVLCTSAFGMGINKPNVRWVVHFQAPALLSEYLQEVGRGGRDGQPTQALAFVSEPTGLLDPSDHQRHKFWQDQLYKQYLHAQRISAQIPSQGDIKTIKAQFRYGEMALSLLFQAQKLEWLDPFHYQLTKNQSETSLVHANVTQQQKQLEMLKYLRTQSCRWQFLLYAFGFGEQAQRFRCGHCDNCLRNHHYK